MLSNRECKQAALEFQQLLAANPDSPESGILLGIAYDCAGDRAGLTAAFDRIWDHDLDSQQPTPEIALINGALNSNLRLQPQTEHGKYFEALLYCRVGQYDAAAAELQKAAAPIADSWSYYNLLGTVYLRQSRFSEARTALEAALARNHKRADTFYKLGTVLLAAGDVSAATSRLRQAVKLRPAFPAAHAALGIALLEAGELVAARDAFMKGTSIGAEIYVYLGTANEGLGDNKTAIENYRAARAQDPQLSAAELSLGRVLLSIGQAAEAVEHLQRASILDPGKAQVELYLALALLASNQKDDAIAAAARARSSGTAENADFHDALGGVFQSLSRPAEAQQCYERAVSLDHAKEDYFRHLAAAQRKGEDNAGTLATLQSGIVHLPASARLHYLLGITRMSLGSSAEALEPLRKAVELEPSSPEYQRALGLCWAELEKDDEAMASFRRALSLDPDQAATYLQIGMLQLKAGGTEEAEQSFRKALSIDRNYAPAYFRLGKIYYDRNNGEQALRFLERTRELDPEWEDTYFLLGTLYKRAGREEEATQMFTIFRNKKNEVQNLRRRTYDNAPDIFEDAKPRVDSR
jgi:tetratricopeptide (TPR) repeat protein